MRPGEREVAGLSCSAVMAALSEFVDAEGSPDLRAQIEAHVAECDWCRQFGDDFARLLALMRRQLAEPEPVPADVLQRLRCALEEP